ncbi:MAG: M17 family peptidase N-terminal domain-containing protein, partial [Pseudomonadota bacterium]
MQTTTSNRVEITFAALDADRQEHTVLLAGKDTTLSATGRAIDEACDGAVVAAAGAADFTGKPKSTVDVLAPRGVPDKRIIVLGIGDGKPDKPDDWINLGGQVMGLLLGRKVKAASIIVEAPHGAPDVTAAHAAEIALGAQLRHYKFRKYKTKDAADDDADASAGSQDGVASLSIHCSDPSAASSAFVDGRAIANGVHLARDLTNEPANALGPVEFAERAKALEDVGLKVEVLEPEQLAELGMGAMLGVAQGSDRPARLAIMQWLGAADQSAPPVAFVGKGVVFDTGGISIKPAQGMEDMKGDMGGAACVTGLMRTLAERKAKVNAIGLIGCVENMPSAKAQRPGDVVTSMSGQT